MIESKIPISDWPEFRKAMAIIFRLIGMHERGAVAADLDYEGEGTEDMYRVWQGGEVDDFEGSLTWPEQGPQVHDLVINLGGTPAQAKTAQMAWEQMVAA